MPSGFHTKPGRPTRMTKPVKAAIIKHISQGNYLETAAAASGIPPRTVRDYMRRGCNDHAAHDDTAHAQFYLAATQAMAKCEAQAAEQLRDADIKTWLDRGPSRSRWGKERDDTPIILDILENVQQYMSESAYRELLSAVAKHRGHALPEVAEQPRNALTVGPNIPQK